LALRRGLVTADALELAVAQNPDVISISWGWDVDDKKLDDLQLADSNMYNELMDIARIIDDAVSDGVIVVCAAGNGHKAFPACLENVIAVGGVTVRADSSLGASNCASSFVSSMYTGRNVPDLCGLMGQTNPESGHIMLPVPADSRLDGHNLHPAHKGQGWGVFSGTSAAAPQVAGIVALILSMDRHLDVHQVKRILARSCTDITSGVTYHKEPAVQGPDLATGSGLVNAFKACAFITGAGNVAS
jgi:subtilisin family serine protease